MGFYSDGFGCCCGCTIRHDGFELSHSGVLSDFYDFSPSGWLIRYNAFATNNIGLQASGNNTITWDNYNYKSLYLGTNVLISGVVSGDNFDLLFDDYVFNVLVDGTVPNANIVLSSDIDGRIATITASELFEDVTDPLIGFNLQTENDNVVEASGMPYSMLYFYSQSEFYNARLSFCNKEIAPTGQARTFGIRINQGHERIFFDNVNFDKRSIRKSDTSACACYSPNPCENFCDILPTSLMLEVEGFWGGRTNSCEYNFGPEGLPSGQAADLNGSWMTSCVPLAESLGYFGDDANICCSGFLPHLPDYQYCNPAFGIDIPSCEDIYGEGSCELPVCVAITGMDIPFTNYDSCVDECWDCHEVRYCSGLAESMNGLHELTWMSGECQWRGPVIESDGVCGSGYFSLEPTFTFYGKPGLNGLGSTWNGVYGEELGVSENKIPICHQPSGIHLTSLTLGWRIFPAGFVPSTYITMSNIKTSDGPFEPPYSGGPILASGHKYLYDFNNMHRASGNFYAEPTAFITSVVQDTLTPDGRWYNSAILGSFSGECGYIGTSPHVSGHRPAWRLYQ